MFTLYSADYINAPSNCSYPHRFEVTDSANFADAVSRDYVCAAEGVGPCSHGEMG